MWSISQLKNPKHMVSTLAAWEPAKAVWRQPTTLDEYFWTWYTIYVKLISQESFRKNMLKLWTEGLPAQRIAFFVCQLISPWSFSFSCSIRLRGFSVLFILDIIWKLWPLRGHNFVIFLTTYPPLLVHVVTRPLNLHLNFWKSRSWKIKVFFTP